MGNPRWTPVPRIIPITAPGAGVEIDIVPTTSGGWLIRTIRATLVTSAAVATRTPTLSADDTISEWYRAAPGATQAASLTRVYSGFHSSAGAASAGPVIAWGIPADGLWLPQGHHLRTITDLIDVGDQWSNVVISVIEFPTGPNVQLWPAVTAYTEETI